MVARSCHEPSGALGESLAPFVAEPGAIGAALRHRRHAGADRRGRPRRLPCPKRRGALLGSSSGGTRSWPASAGGGRSRRGGSSGIDSIAYVGNHGLELLAPARRAPSMDPAVEAARRARAGVRDTRYDDELRRARRRGSRTRTRSGRSIGAAPATKPPRDGRWSGSRRRPRARTAYRTGAARCSRSGRRSRPTRAPRWRAARRAGDRRARSTPATTRPMSTRFASCASSSAAGRVAGALRRRSLRREGRRQHRRRGGPRRGRPGGGGRSARRAGRLEAQCATPTSSRQPCSWPPARRRRSPRSRSPWRRPGRTTGR